MFGKDDAAVVIHEVTAYQERDPSRTGPFADRSIRARPDRYVAQLNVRRSLRFMSRQSAACWRASDIRIWQPMSELHRVVALRAMRSRCDPA